MSPFLRSPVRRASVTDEAESWFLERGLPSVLTTRGFYVTLGLIVLTPALLKESARTTDNDTTVLGLTVPLPDSLVHLCLFLGALTFMYISARAAGDDDYRSNFVDPLIGDLHTTLTARNRYRNRMANAPVTSVDGADLGD